MKIKTCGKCKIDKNVEHFSKRAASDDGLQIYCKSCMCNFQKRNQARKRRRANAKKRYETAKNEGRVQTKQPASAQRGIEVFVRWLQEQPDWQEEINKMLKKAIFGF